MCPPILIKFKILVRPPYCNTLFLSAAVFGVLSVVMLS